jgi:hypothetical protein
MNAIQFPPCLRLFNVGGSFFMRIKYKNYEALMIHEKGNRSGFGCDFADEALKRFQASKTAVRMVLFVSTHNNTRLKKYAEYGLEFK